MLQRCGQRCLVSESAPGLLDGLCTTQTVPDMSPFVLFVSSLYPDVHLHRVHSGLRGLLFRLLELSSPKLLVPLLALFILVHFVCLSPLPSCLRLSMPLSFGALCFFCLPVPLLLLLLSLSWCVVFLQATEDVCC